MADIIGTEGPDTLTGTPDSDFIQGFGGNDTLRGRAGDDSMYGGTGRDILEGGAGIDDLDGGAGNDRLVAGGGEYNILNGGTGEDTMIGGTGDDEYYVDNEDDVVIETADDSFDRIWTSIDYTLSNNSNIEVLSSTSETGVTLTGNSHDNTLWDGEGHDVLRGGGGDDTIFATNGGGDILLGGAGNDYLSTEFFEVTMRGGTGNDYYFLYYAGNTSIIEHANEGIDTVETQRDHTLSNNVENLIINTDDIDEDPSVFVFTGTGNSLNNRIEVEGTANTLYGLGGNDVLISDATESTTLYGGGGRDRLHVDINTLGSGPTMTLMDFEHDVDTIVLTSDDDLALPSGNLGSLRFYAGSGAGAVAQTDAHRIIYDLSSGNLYYDPDGTGATAQTLFAVLSGTSEDVDRTDFVVA
jgi:Ca2+-binding RTX toxin-like protein